MLYGLWEHQHSVKAKYGRSCGWDGMLTADEGQLDATNDGIEAEMGEIEASFELVDVYVDGRPV